MKQSRVNDEKSKIEKTINTYVKGYLEANASLVAQAFYPQTTIYCSDAGSVDRTKLSDWLKNLEERKAAADLRTAELMVKFIDITDDAAVAKIKLCFSRRTFIDYLSLLKISDEWIIVGKIYSLQDQVEA